MGQSASTQFGIEVVLRVTQAHRRELLQTVERLQQRVVSEGRGGICEVFEDSVVPNRFLWTEWWPTEQAVDVSLTSDRFATLQAAIRHLGRIEVVRRVDLTREIPVKHATDAVRSDLGLDPERS